ncbi:hypothetical protein HYQ46_000492 [Verticillium longisporum]|nr:hypothetical protein HYQ46_000492 [Verticillium longisporum]
MAGLDIRSASTPKIIRFNESNQKGWPVYKSTKSRHDTSDTHTFDPLGSHSPICIYHEPWTPGSDPWNSSAEFCF